MDTTELPQTDDLWQPGPAIREAERRYAEAAGAAETLFLTGGSTAGVHAMLQLWAREGETVILPRNAHLSAVNACILGGLEIAWISASRTADGYVYIREKDALAVIAAHPEAKAILLTRPDYMGGCLLLARIIRAAHAAGIRAIVDEAHGAHFPWMDGFDSAGAAGADAWVQSAHKTLPALTGTAVLHLRDAADRPEMMRLLRREQSSSPNYLLVRSIDDARVWMDRAGKDHLRQVTAMAEAFRQRLPALGYADAQMRWSGTGYAFDPTRLVIRAPQGGDRLGDQLRERGIDIEMTYGPFAVLILTAMNRPEDFDALEAALREIPRGPEWQAELDSPVALPPRRMPVRAAAMAPSRLIPIAEAVGLVCAESAGLYPPGIPLAVPGEELTAAVCAALAGAGADRRFGTKGEMIRCVV